MTTPSDFDRGPRPLRCTNCGFDNPPGRGLCQNCGLPLGAATQTVLSDDLSETPVHTPSTLPLKRRTCPSCGHTNLPAARTCARCGAAMDISDLFKKSVPPPPPAAPPPDLPPVTVTAAQRLATGTALRLEIIGAASTLRIAPAGESIIGRRDPISNSAPDVDLTSFAAYRMGISRQHAALRVTDGVVELTDLDSSNGTSVNGERLKPNEPYPLRDGDEIGLGRMLLRICFVRDDENA